MVYLMSVLSSEYLYTAFSHWPPFIQLILYNIFADTDPTINVLPHGCITIPRFSLQTSLCILCTSLLTRWSYYSCFRIILHVSMSEGRKREQIYMESFEMSEKN